MGGTIHQDAHQPWLERGRVERLALDHFLSAGFSVSWAREIHSHNTRLRCCFLQPDQSLKEQFGFEYQILLVFHPYNQLEPRTFQAINRFMNGDPAKGRVEPMVYFLVSPAHDVAEWTNRYLLENRDERVAIPVLLGNLTSSSVKQWTIRNAIQQRYLSIDVFKNTLPLQGDTYFFGRQHELARLLDAAKKGENIGLFGLRKTGKTSLLLKLQRVLTREGGCFTLMLDAQSTSIRKRRWHELLHYIATQVGSHLGSAAPHEFSEIDAADYFGSYIGSTLRSAEGSTKRIVLIFDEIEWIAPGLAKDEHWEDDFLAFWQVIRSFQTQQRVISVVVAGVNPSIVESDILNEYPNPLFGIVSPVFLRGLSRDESDDMVIKIGKVIGLRFSDDALDYLYVKYGGHPLLTRLACSYTFEEARAIKRDFPVQVTESLLRKQSQGRDRELRFYCRHIVSELEKFYPAEYRLLELLAIGELVAFVNGARREDGARHLFNYGIVRAEETPFVEYEVVQDYVAEENARRMGRPTRSIAVATSERSSFVNIRMTSIVEDMRVLEGLIRQCSEPSLFGPNSFPMADRLFNVKPPVDAGSLGAALTPLQLAFVESIDNFGKSQGDNGYFWKVIKNHYPSLHEALNRIRAYRNNAQHLLLNPAADASFRFFLDRDLPGDLIHSEDKYWIVFQACLDELLRALQREISDLRD